MGTIIHHAIVVTGGKEMLIEAAMTAQNMGFTVLGPGPSLINGYCSMLVCPDGSKEYWPSSDVFDKKRAEFCKWLEALRDNNSKREPEWIEIAFGSEFRPEIINDCFIDY